MGLLGILAVPILLFSIAAPAAWAQPDTEETAGMPLGFAFEVSGGASNTISFEVPEGMVPVGFKADLLGTTNTELRVRTPERGIIVAPTSAGSLSFPLEARDRDESGKVTLTFALPPGTWCNIDGTPQDGFTTVVTVSNAVLEVEGNPEPPTSVSNFLSDGVSEVQIDIGTHDVQTLVDASLNMAAGAARSVPSADVNLTVAGKQPAASAANPTGYVPPFAKRKIVLAPGSSPVTSSMGVSSEGVPTLTLTGGARDLAEAAKAFGRPGIVVASDEETENLTFTGMDGGGSDAAAPEPNSLTLEELGTNAAVVEGYGRQDLVIPVPQGAFNRQLKEVALDLVGAVSTTPNTVGTVQFLWNDELIDSFTLDHNETTFERRVTVPEENLRSGNLLTLRLQAVTADNKCIDESLLPPVRVDLDTAESTVSVKAGSVSDVSFQQFPQTFGNSLPVAFGVQASDVELSATGALVAALQRATPTALQVAVVEPSSFLKGSDAGILVGMTPTQAKTVGAPVYVADPRAVTGPDGEVSVDAEGPIAALQVVKHNKNPILLLGADGGDMSADANKALMQVVSGLQGSNWWSLDGSARVATGDEPAVSIEVAGPNLPGNSSLTVVLWTLGATILLLALLAAFVGVTSVRKSKRANKSD